MSCGYLTNEIDSMFENETDEIHNDTLLSDKLLWNSDNLSITSNDINWDTFIYDDINGHLYDQPPDKSKDKLLLDFDYNLTEFNEIFDSSISTSKNPIKLEPTHTNSVTSSYLTDDCSPTSSNNNSPVVRKVKKRDFQHMLDSSSEKSFALYENENDNDEYDPSKKSAKLEIVKKESTVLHQSGAPRTIYKLSRDSAATATREPIILGNIGSHYPRQIVKIRPTPYIVSSNIKSVNISKYSAQEKQFLSSSSSSSTTNASQNHHHHNHNPYSPSIAADQDCDILTGEFYDHEVDLYSDYKSRVSTSYINQNGFASSNNGGALFQTPIPQSGPLFLTDEEKRTLIQENYPIPTRVPLSKQEERNLKKVRRKIKNKLSAQESRRKKKEYVDALEKKVEAYEQERIESKRRIETLENQQRTLQNQIRHYQHQMMNKITGTGNTTSTGLMLFMICFALILVGGSFPSSFRKMNLPQSSLISSSSLYYMGYGPSRNILNNSYDILMNERHVREKPDRFIDNTVEVDDVIPRQSILLGEDNDDRKFEELVLSYSKPTNKKICDSSRYLMGRAAHPIHMIKNSSFRLPTSQREMVIASMVNVILVK